MNANMKVIQYKNYGCVTTFWVKGYCFNVNRKKLEIVYIIYNYIFTMKKGYKMGEDIAKILVAASSEYEWLIFF